MRLERTGIVLAALAAAPLPAHAQSLEQGFQTVRSQVQDVREDARAWGARPTAWGGDRRPTCKRQVFLSPKARAVETYKKKKAELEEISAKARDARWASRTWKLSGPLGAYFIGNPMAEQAVALEREAARQRRELEILEDKAVGLGGLVRTGGGHKENLEPMVDVRFRCLGDPG